MSAARAVTATFTLDPVNHTLTVTKAGTGSGTVTSSPAGINCGATCSASYAGGHRRHPHRRRRPAGSTFAGWSGACTGTGTCQVTMSAARSVTATFTLPPSRADRHQGRHRQRHRHVEHRPASTAARPAARPTPAACVVDPHGRPRRRLDLQRLERRLLGPRGLPGLMSAARSVTATFALTTPPPPPGGLVAAWGFNDGTGTSARDSSANGNTGALVNGPAWTTGRYGGALLFDGSNDRVRVSDSSSLDLTAAATFEAWVYPTAAPSGWRTILQKEVDAYFFTASGGGGSGNTPTTGGTFNGACCTFLSGMLALAANTWTHVAATYDGARLRLYVNGTLVASTPRTGSYQVTAAPLWIGGNAVYGEHFRGKLDEVRIYRRALSQAEIQQDMAAAIP